MCTKQWWLICINLNREEKKKKKKNEKIFPPRLDGIQSFFFTYFRLKQGTTCDIYFFFYRNQRSGLKLLIVQIFPRTEISEVIKCKWIALTFIIELIAIFTRCVRISSTNQSHSFFPLFETSFLRNSPPRGSHGTDPRDLLSFISIHDSPLQAILVLSPSSPPGLFQDEILSAVRRKPSTKNGRDWTTIV